MASTIRRARSLAVGAVEPVDRPNLVQGGKFSSRHRRAGRPGSDARGIPRRLPGTCTAAVRSCATNSPACSRVLNGTSTAPMRVRAIATCTQRAPLGMISPTRVPLPTPASTNAAAKSFVVESSSR